jgi:monomeric isocitrate dehydrogenase
MVEAIIALVSTVLVFWLKRRIAREKDRAKQLEEALKDVDKNIADGDVDAINRSLELSLRRLSLRDRDRRQQESGETSKG